MEEENKGPKEYHWEKKKKKKDVVRGYMPYSPQDLSSGMWPDAVSTSTADESIWGLWEPLHKEVA